MQEKAKISATLFAVAKVIYSSCFVPKERVNTARE
jgi:hypothetical protein